MSEKMQASWRLREQQRKQGAADEARRRAVEVSEISFPSLVSSASVASSGWGVAPLTPAVSAAAERWTSGAASVASYVTPAAPSATAGGTRTIAIPKRVGIHASISAEVRRTTTGRTAVETTYSQGDDDDDAGDDGWTEVSSSRSKKPPATKSKFNFNTRTDDDEDEDYFGSGSGGGAEEEEEEEEENMYA